MIPKSGRFMIKVCGITNLQDGKLAVDCGSDMIGVVRARESPRFAPRAVIREVKDLGVPVVGVYTRFSDIPEDPDEDMVQLHFNHTAGQIESLKERGVGTVSVIQFRSMPDFIGRYEEYREAGTSLIMLESKTGIMKQRDSLLHMSMMYDFGISGKITAGDLPEICRIKPKFIDLNSSLEQSPGRKDPVRMREFFSKVEECD